MWPMPISKITGTCCSFCEKSWLPEDSASGKGFSGSVMRRNLDPVAIRVLAEETIDIQPSFSRYPPTAADGGKRPYRGGSPARPPGCIRPVLSTVLFDQILPVFRRTDALFLPEDLGKVTRILIPDFKADLQDTQVRLLQKFFCYRYPDGGQVLQK